LPWVSGSGRAAETLVSCEIVNPDDVPPVSMILIPSNTLIFYGAYFLEKGSCATVRIISIKFMVVRQLHLSLIAPEMG
jgi:hypothetical protein